jgi:serine O-acetyltransferase
MLFGIEISVTATIGRRLTIEHHGGIVIHGSAVIGDDCLIRHGVTLSNQFKDHHTEAPVIGNRVEIGAGAQVLGNVTVGDDAFIGANAVVVEDVPPGVAVFGVPARIVQDPRTTTG